jgi:hypothetical protein
MSNDPIIVPFGKYKGQPMEVLLSDTSYISYQKQQPGFMKWLEENHVTIYNIFTTGAQQVQDTPEHNKLQARFLDKKFCNAVISLIGGDAQQIYDVKVAFETSGYDVDLDIMPGIKNYISASSYYNCCQVRVEIKPNMGDNYPAVLRQMRVNQRQTSGSIDALLIGKFESESINIDQLRGIFGHYKIVLLSEIEEKLASYK